MVRLHLHVSLSLSASIAAGAADCLIWATQWAAATLAILDLHPRHIYVKPLTGLCRVAQPCIEEPRPVT